MFVLDTSIWIHLRTHYPPDIFTNLWEQLDRSIAVGDVRSPEEVLHELERGTDDLPALLAAREDLFAPLDEGLQGAVAEVMRRCPGLIDGDGERNRADPFVVALARRRNGIVVTKERPRRGATGRLRIPDACAELDVPCLDWLEFLRAVGWRL